MLVILEHCPMRFFSSHPQFNPSRPPIVGSTHANAPYLSAFFNQGHSLMIAYLDSREMYGLFLFMHIVYSAYSWFQHHMESRTMESDMAPED